LSKKANRDTRSDAAMPQEAVAPRTGPDMEARLQEIRKLEKELVSLKQDLLFSTATVTPDPRVSSLNFLLIRIGEHTLAAPISFVEEVVEMPAIKTLREQAETIVGLVDYHGELLAVVDVGQLIGMEPSAATARKALVICKVEPRLFALMVDEAIEVVTTSPDAITISDEVLPGLLKAAGLVKLPGGGSAFIMDLGWLSVGAHLAGMLGGDAATPLEGDKS